MKRICRKYKRPKRPYDKARIEREKELLKAYGLRRKREVWRAEAMLRKYRRLARRLAAQADEKVRTEMMDRLVRLGILKKGAGLDDVLGLTVEDILARRLQTVLVRRKLANTPRHARQLIVHGHVRIGGRRVTHPGYLTLRAEENKIEVTLKRG
jgi:small subunit ribosomal protein S4